MKSRQAGASMEIKITHQMVEAGVETLRASHALAAESSSDAYLVQAILASALFDHEAERQNYLNSSKAKKIAVDIARHLG